MDWRQKERERLQASLRDDTYTANGVLCWKSCRHQEDRPVPLHVFQDAGVTPPPGQEAAEALYYERSLADYRARMANHVYSEEELFEMRAAFGAGAEVVNVLTGRKIKL